VIIILTRPILDSLKIIDGNISNKIKYNVIGGDQVFGYQVRIYDNSTNGLVYDNKAFSFIFEISINNGILVNGREYKLQIRTFNGIVLNDLSNLEGNTSDYSDYLILKCYSTPIVNIDNIPVDSFGNNLIKNQTFVFTGNYSQAEGVALKSFRYLLYDKNKVLSEIFDEVYQLTGELTQEITGFDNNEDYYIQLLTINQYNIETRSALIKFHVEYIEPRIRQVIKAENDFENALIKVEARVVVLYFESDNYTFENNDWVNIKNSNMHLTQGYNFNINGDFTMKIWAKDLTSNTDLLNMIGGQGNIRVILKDYRFHVYKEYSGMNNIYSHYASDIIDSYDSNTVFFIFLQQIGGMLNIQFEKVS
jgi:hypothetical protein